MQLKNTIDAAYSLQPNVAKRFRYTMEWLSQFEIAGHCLDVGDRTMLTDVIEQEFEVRCDNSTGDLDYTLEAPRGAYDNIFCFEVLEHLMNPLLFIENLKRRLKTDGAMYFSTPTRKPNFLRDAEHHFHEFNRNELEALLEKAGLIMTHETVINSVPWWWAFKGVRTLLRYVHFNRTLLFRVDIRT